PPLVVRRPSSASAPAASFTASFHSRNEYFPRFLPSFAGVQVFPPSSETATSLMPLPPSKAIPFSIVVPGRSFEPSRTLVIKERTVKRLIGIVALGAVPGSTQPHGVSGIRYADFIQKPSKTSS